MNNKLSWLLALNNYIFVLNIVLFFQIVQYIHASVAIWINFYLFAAVLISAGVLTHMINRPTVCDDCKGKHE